MSAMFLTFYFIFLFFIFYFILFIILRHVKCYFLFNLQFPFFICLTDPVYPGCSKNTSVNNSVINKVMLYENTFNKPLFPSRKSWSWNFEGRFTSPHLSRVRYYMSRVKCLMSLCHISHVTCQKYFLFPVFRISSTASQWRICYQRDLPRLVFTKTHCYYRSYKNPPPVSSVSTLAFPTDLSTKESAEMKTFKVAEVPGGKPRNIPWWL